VISVPSEWCDNIDQIMHSLHLLFLLHRSPQTVQAIDNALTQYLGCSARKLQNGTWVGNSPGCIVRRIVYKRKAVGNRVKNKQNPELRPRPSEEPMDTPADRGRPQFRVSVSVSEINCVAHFHSTTDPPRKFVGCKGGTSDGLGFCASSLHSTCGWLPRDRSPAYRLL
jgi:hypothetical protein